MTDFAAMRVAMVEGQVRTNDVTDRRIVAAMKELPREAFAPQDKAAVAYADLHVELAPGRVLLRPRDFAKLAQALDIQPYDRALDLACGRGYSAAVLARMASGVVAVEEDADLAIRAQTLLAEQGAANVAVLQRKLAEGAPEEGPFDVILVNGAVAEPPRAWFDQLANGGRLGVFERPRGVGRAVLYRRDNGAVGRRELFDAEVPWLPGFTPAPAFVF